MILNTFNFENFKKMMDRINSRESTKGSLKIQDTSIEEILSSQAKERIRIAKTSELARKHILC